MDEKRGLLVAGLLWAWWNARNRCNAGDPLMRVEAITLTAHEVISQGDDVRTTNPRPAAVGRRSWQPLPVDVLKINFDGASKAATKEGAWGFIIRDSDGQAIVAGSGRLSLVVDAACIAALDVAMVRGISRVIIETDSTNLVSALCSNAFDRAPGGTIFSEARSILMQHFVPVSISSISRTCNRCAHELASLGFARDPDLPGVWDDPLPEFVSTLVDRDHADPEFA